MSTLTRGLPVDQLTILEAGEPEVALGSIERTRIHNVVVVNVADVDEPKLTLSDRMSLSREVRDAPVVGRFRVRVVLPEQLRLINAGLADAALGVA